MAKQRDACPLSPVHEYMREVATKIDLKAHVSEDAAKLLRKVVQDQASAVVSKALTLVDHADRKKLMKADVDLAINMPTKKEA